MFYNDSRHTNPHLGGAGFTVFREKREICGGFETKLKFKTSPLIRG